MTAGCCGQAQLRLGHLRRVSLFASTQARPTCGLRRLSATGAMLKTLTMRRPRRQARNSKALSKFHMKVARMSPGRSIRTLVRRLLRVSSSTADVRG